MQTIRITITSEKPTNVVFTERRSESKEAKKKAALRELDELFNPILKEACASDIGVRNYAIKRRPN